MDSAWEHRRSGTIDHWFVADRQDGFAPNMNVLEQSVPGVSLDGYLQISRRELSTYGFDTIAVIGTILRDGSPAGLFEYVADGPTELADEGEPALRSLELLPTS